MDLVAAAGAAPAGVDDDDAGKASNVAYHGAMTCEKSASAKALELVAAWSGFATETLVAAIACSPRPRASDL